MWVYFFPEDTMLDWFRGGGGADKCLCLVSRIILTILESHSKGFCQPYKRDDVVVCQV